MCSYVLSDESDKNKLVNKLRGDLWMLRHDLIQLLPYELVKILGSYGNCLESKTTYKWLDEVAEEIIAYVESLEPAVSEWGSREKCPLCGRGANSSYQEGFAFPEGMRRHLVGYGSVHQCLFTAAAGHLARDYW